MSKWREAAILAFLGFSTCGLHCNESCPVSDPSALASHADQLSAMKPMRVTRTNPHLPVARIEATASRDVLALAGPSQALSELTLACIPSRADGDALALPSGVERTWLTPSALTKIGPEPYTGDVLLIPVCERVLYRQNAVARRPAKHLDKRTDSRAMRDAAFLSRVRHARGSVRGGFRILPECSGTISRPLG